MLLGLREDKYVEIAKKTEVFKPQELDVLKEMIVEYYNKPNGDYILLEERSNEELIGFVIFGRTSLTQFGWDIYWLLVDKDFQKRGVGKRLLQRVEEYILDRDSRAILRVETSSKIQYKLAREFYLKRDFLSVGLIPDFYESGDDLIMLSKCIRREN